MLREYATLAGPICPTYGRDVLSRPPENQPGAGGAMGEAEDSQAEANDRSGRSQEDRSGAAGKVGEGEARELERRH